MEMFVNINYEIYIAISCKFMNTALHELQP